MKSGRGRWQDQQGTESWDDLSVTRKDRLEFRTWGKSAGMTVDGAPVYINN